jgi:hypothetical protein
MALCCKEFFDWEKIDSFDKSKKSLDCNISQILKIEKAGCKSLLFSYPSETIVYKDRTLTPRHPPITDTPNESPLHKIDYFCTPNHIHEQVNPLLFSGTSTYFASGNYYLCPCGFLRIC